MKRHQLLIIVLALLTGSFSYAQRGGRQVGGPTSPDQIMTALDKNEDGKISLDEAKTGADKRIVEYFQRMDVNKDGFVDKLELIGQSRYVPEKAIELDSQQLLSEVDIDQDGFIDEFEVAARDHAFLKNHFTEIDKNLDGKLDEIELSSFGKKDKKKDKKKRKKKQ